MARSTRHPRGVRERAVKLTGEGGLLGRLTKVVIESALEGEMHDLLGYGEGEKP